ncbi:uncharacterized protein Z518_00923 [Rhinocladiella mackenziei CBS 650.93]|uniref:non-specific serine/threonine protein kinase n=1 Tax=Rhinocladiella mackenziei CBS 650.93 TaxID=1442369 RepID=A0A0D2G516_9EURO|nr:uncharacterized protein Z518_00923 [Rhinocladiella mackenziei CBS 650.93]KIX09842.1 hypothetical protein Z518_00923 [Rhinocladiella mackenziei CBS 650.93]
MTANGQRFIGVERNGRTERLIIDQVMPRGACVAGRATTCWKAHPEGDAQTPPVIKDSWQYLEREEEGELLREATDKGVVNMARYHYHDDIQSNVRKGLDVTEARNYQSERSMISASTASARRKGRTSSTVGLKRPSSYTDAPLPPSKRPCSASPTQAINDALPNRIHQHVILRDYGKPIYNASSRASLLTALEGCIERYESLYKAGVLHRDISLNNIMVNEDDNNPSWSAFLIDLDFGIKETREKSSGAKGKTGTGAFMAIGVLLGEQHSFMHDLESFFWVLFWICIHCNGLDKSRVVPSFEATGQLALLKKGEICHVRDFVVTAEENFTSYHQPLIPWVNRLRRVVFPDGRRWKKGDTGLYSRMKQILREARKDPMV